MTSKEVIVSISLDGENIRVGNLWFHTRGARASASFEYNKKWLAHPERFALDPALKLTEGSFHTPAGLSLFGAIGDSAPDRWGRILMRRAETVRAKNEKVIANTLCEIDYLLGVSDEVRQGALRFSLESQEDLFLKSSNSSSIPPLIHLPKLLSATEHFLEDQESSEELKLLLAPGSSLGGARPKACVIDKEGNLAIAKFPRKDDEFNVVVWEAIALTLAQNAGITIPPWRLEKILGKSVLIIKRFDRIKENRIPFLSAMSMLSAQDNEPHSYIEMAYILAQQGAQPTEDMKELWRRIVFTVLISNTDNHLRNHGFLYERSKGWRLSPAYDMNPTPIEIKAPLLATTIGFNDPSASLEAALEVSAEFRLSLIQARAILQEVKKAVIEWRRIASGFKVSKQECDRMASAFSLAL